MVNLRFLLLLGLIISVLRTGIALAADASVGPAYQIVLRSRHAQAMPAKSPLAQTGGGWIAVAQPEPNTIIITMGGSAVVGSAMHGSVAGVHFELAQDFDIIPLRSNVRPPRVGMIGRVVGTLQLSDPGKLGHYCGSAQQGPAVASLALGEMNVLSLDVQPSAVECGQDLSINHQSGPVESPTVASTAEVGSYRLTATFDLSANQGKGVFHRHYAVADFDPAPQLDAFWADALKPFRAVPRENFGFTLVVRVVEDAAPAVGASDAKGELSPPSAAGPSR